MNSSSAFRAKLARLMLIFEAFEMMTTKSDFFIVGLKKRTSEEVRYEEESSFIGFIK
jgi:hypothetical protein